MIIAVLFSASCGDRGGDTNGKEGKKDEFVPSDKLLRSYIKAEQEIAPLRRRARREVIDTVREYEIELQRFRDLDEAKDPQTLKRPIQEEEKEVLESIRKKRKKIYDSKAARMERRAEDKGLKWSQYRRVRNAIREKWSAQERFKEMRDSTGSDLPLPPIEEKSYTP